MDFGQLLRTVDTVTRVARKTQLMIKDAPKVKGVIDDYKLDRMYAIRDTTTKPAEVKSRNRFKKIIQP